MFVKCIRVWSMKITPVEYTGHYFHCHCISLVHRLSLLYTEQCYGLASVHWPMLASWFISVHQSMLGVHFFILITLTSQCYGFTSVHQPMLRFHLCTLANVRWFQFCTLINARVLLLFTGQLL